MQLSSFFQLPSFGVASAASVVVLFVFIAWDFADASFPAVLVNSWMAEWNELRSRIVLFCVLALAGGGSVSLVAYRLFVGHPNGRSIRALLLAVLLIGLWLAFIISRDRIAEAGLHWRVVRMLPGMKADAAILLDKWPTENGSLPFIGDFAVDAKDPELVVPIKFIRPTVLYPIKDRIGPWVERTEDGGLMFFIDGWLTRIEYRPDSSRPEPFFDSTVGDETHRMELRIEDLEQHWFFVQNITGLQEMKNLQLGN